MEQRRSSDSHIASLISKVEQLDLDVKSLRHEFEDHVENEAIKIDLLNASLTTIQVKLDQLLLEIKEPIEAYKTAKAGVTFLKFASEVAKWLVPLGIGLYLGYGGIINPPEVKPPTEIHSK